MMKTDAQLQADVIAELQWEPAVDAAQIGVEVSGGIVTLAGHVSNYAGKWNAEHAARRVYGVKALVVEIDVTLAGSTRPSRPFGKTMRVISSNNRPCNHVADCALAVAKMAIAVTKHSTKARWCLLLSIAQHAPDHLINIRCRTAFHPSASKVAWNSRMQTVCSSSP